MSRAGVRDHLHLLRGGSQDLCLSPLRLAMLAVLSLDLGDDTVHVQVLLLSIFTMTEVSEMWAQDLDLLKGVGKSHAFGSGVWSGSHALPWGLSTPGGESTPTRPSTHRQHW